MNHFIGWGYLPSMLLLTVIVAGVYSAAQEAFAPAREVVRHAAVRGAKLLGVLGGLAVLVHFLGKI